MQLLYECSLNAGLLPMHTFLDDYIHYCIIKNSESYFYLIVVNNLYGNFIILLPFSYFT